MVIQKTKQRWQMKRWLDSEVVWETV